MWFALLALVGAAAALKIDSVPCHQPGLVGNPGAQCSVYYFFCKPGASRSRKLACAKGTLFDQQEKRCKPAFQIKGCERFAVTRSNNPVSRPISRPVSRPINRRPAKPFRQSSPKVELLHVELPQASPIRPKFVPNARPVKTFRPKFVPQPQPRNPLPRSKVFRPRPQPRPQPRPVPRNPIRRNAYGSVVSDPKQPVVDFECVGLPDGDYAKGCSNIYYSCLAEKAMERECPMISLKFDQDQKACLMAEEVRDCGGQPTTPAPFVPSAPVEKDPRCSGKASGVFEMQPGQCSNNFLTCNSGFAVEMECAANLIFDVETNSCLGRMYVQSCGGAPTPKPLPLEPTPAAPVDPSMQCGGKADGDYAHPTKQCAYQYMSCVGGVPMVRECASKNLRFDPVKGLCDEEQYVGVCGGSPRPPQADTTTHAPFVNPSEFSCKGLPDGLHDDHYGCSAIFYACSGGSASKFKCSGNLVFDTDSKRCISKNYVTACSGSPTPVPTIVDDVGTPLPPADIDFDCGKGEGAHSLGCSADYVVCSFGRPYSRSCASAHLRFDSEKKLCAAEAEVLECGGHPTPKPAPAQPYAAPVKVDFDCSSQVDGVYADSWEPCSPHFFTCSSGTAAKIACPAGLMYDTAQEACLNEAYISACGGQPTPKPGSVPQSPVQSYRPRQPAPRPKPRFVQTPPKFIPRPSPPKFIPRPQPPKFIPRRQTPPRPIQQKFRPRQQTPPRPRGYGAPQPRPQPQQAPRSVPELPRNFFPRRRIVPRPRPQPQFNPAPRSKFAPSPPKPIQTPPRFNNGY